MAIKKAAVSKEGLKIANTMIQIGKTYEIAHKFDGSAPDGMQEIGATKYPLKGVAENRAIYFDTNRNVFDTGFYVESVCNSRIPQTENPAEQIKLYNDLVKNPYEKVMNKNCDATNFDFWDNYKYEVKVNKSFNTSDPKDLFDLFHALKQGAICNEGEPDSVLQKAKYTIRNIEAIKNVEDEKFANKMKALNTFNMLLDNDIEKVYVILEFLNYTRARTTDKESLRMTYSKLLDDPKKGKELVNRFLEATEKYNSDRGKLEMQYFSVAQSLYLKSKITQKAGALYHEDGSYLANSIRDIATKCAGELDLVFKEKIDTLYQKYFSE